MSKESDFFIYLIENYAEYKNTTADKVLANWEKLGIDELIYDLYEIYHSERLQNAYDDIDKIIEERSN